MTTMLNDDDDDDDNDRDEDDESAGRNANLLVVRVRGSRRIKRRPSGRHTAPNTVQNNEAGASFVSFAQLGTSLSSLFLVADTRLYTLPCRSVGPLVRWSVRPSVTFFIS